jgi:hypothetical protein
MTPQSSATRPSVEQAEISSPPHTDPVQSQTDREQPVSPELKPYLCRRPVRLALYAILIGLVLLMLGWRFLPGLLDPTFEKHIQNKQVIVGMSRQQVLKAWGSPYSMNVTYTKDGIRREEWVYEDWVDAATVKHRYLYFEEDELLGGWYYK